MRAGGCQLSTAGLQLIPFTFLHQRRQHPLHLYYLRGEALVVWIVQIFQIMSEQKLVFKFLPTPSQFVGTEPSPHHPSCNSPPRYSSRSMMTRVASGLSDRTFHPAEKSCSMHKHPESTAKSSSQNSSPASAVSSHSAPVQRAQQRFPTTIFRFPAIRPVDRYAWIHRP